MIFSTTQNLLEYLKNKIQAYLGIDHILESLSEIQRLIKLINTISYNKVQHLCKDKKSKEDYEFLSLREDISQLNETNTIRVDEIINLLMVIKNDLETLRNEKTK